MFFQYFSFEYSRVLVPMITTDESSLVPSETNSKLPLLQFLVNNVLFEINEELIQKRIPNSLLASETYRAQFYDIDQKVYIFDQPSDAFEVLVYFISTGLLSRPTNINEMKLYSLLSLFEIDEIVINTLKKLENLACEVNWEETDRWEWELICFLKNTKSFFSSNNSFLHTLFAYPFTPKAKLINTFFFAITIISYGNLCFEYTFALPLFRSVLSSIDNTTMILTPIGLDFSSSTDNFFYLTELIYLLILLIEFSCRFLYASNKLQHFSNYLTIIDLLSIISCIIYLYSLIQLREFSQLIACFRSIRILKLSRYSRFIHQYIQTIISQYEITILLFFIFLSLGLFFSNFIYGLSLIDRSRKYSTPFESFYYIYETIFTIGFGIHLTSTSYLTWITLTSVLFGMMCLSLPVPFLAIYNFNLDNYEQEKKFKMLIS